MEEAVIKLKNTIKYRVKQLNEKTVNVVNFILLVPVYFIGAGLAYLFLKLSNKRVSDNKTYWITSTELSRKLEEYKKQF